MRLAVIPARGGSKRIPQKNIRLFAGKPMLSYAVAAAQASGLFDRVIVSTDDMSIADIARQYGAEIPFTRPASLADDHSPTLPVIQHALNFYRQQGHAVSLVGCIYPAVPLLSADDLQRAANILGDCRQSYAFPVCPFPCPPQRALQRDSKGITRMADNSFAATRSQDLPNAYYDAGQFYLAHADCWQLGQKILDNGKTIIMPPWKAVDIDTEEDWRWAEKLYALGQIEN